MSTLGVARLRDIWAGELMISAGERMAHSNPVAAVLHLMEIHECRGGVVGLDLRMRLPSQAERRDGLLYDGPAWRAPA